MSALKGYRIHLDQKDASKGELLYTCVAYPLFL